MKSQDAVESLRDVLELAPSEAAIYVHLCMAGPAKAGDLAGALKLHRNEVYRNAARLLNRGLIEMTLEHPARYAAVKPDQVFEDELNARLSAVESLKAARDQLTPFLERPVAPEPQERKSVYKVVQGRQEIGAVQTQMIRHARETVLWATTFPSSIPISDLTGGLEALSERVAAGVKLRALVRTTPRGWELLKAIEAMPHADLRSVELEGDVRFLIVDGTELLMWVVNDPSEAVKAKEEVAIQTTAPGFVQAEGVFFEQVWARTPAPK